MKELMTPIEKAREAKHQAICADYATMTAQHTGAKPNRIITMIAQKHSMTIPGITNILKAKGLYTPGKRR